MRYAAAVWNQSVVASRGSAVQPVDGVNVIAPPFTLKAPKATIARWPATLELVETVTEVVLLAAATPVPSSGETVATPLHSVSVPPVAPLPLAVNVAVLMP